MLVAGRCRHRSERPSRSPPRRRSCVVDQGQQPGPGHRGGAVAHDRRGRGEGDARARRSPSTPGTYPESFVVKKSGSPTGADHAAGTRSRDDRRRPRQRHRADPADLRRLLGDRGLRDHGRAQSRLAAGRARCGRAQQRDLGRERASACGSSTGRPATSSSSNSIHDCGLGDFVKHPGSRQERRGCVHRHGTRAARPEPDAWPRSLGVTTSCATT